MNKTILFVVSFFTVNMAWAQQVSTTVPSGSTETVNADSVPIEEYVPKVIIEGKWGTGPGEFGIASRFPLGLYDQYVPSSLAVDSKENIYVLDFVNNRIQKFNKDGKYLTFLTIEGLKGELAGYCAGDTCYEVPPAPGVKYDRAVIGAVESIGINIVIDSKDTLYYYLKRVKDGKETGEVWEFMNDRMGRKSKISEAWPFFFLSGDKPCLSKEDPHMLGGIETFSVVEGRKYAKGVNSIGANTQQPGRIKSKTDKEIIAQDNSGNVTKVILSADQKFIIQSVIFGDNVLAAISSDGKIRIRNRYNLSSRKFRRIRVDTEPRNGLRDAMENIYDVRFSSDASRMEVVRYDLRVMGD